MSRLANYNVKEKTGNGNDNIFDYDFSNNILEYFKQCQQLYSVNTDVVAELIYWIISDCSGIPNEY